MEETLLQKQAGPVINPKEINSKIVSMLVPITIENLLQMAAGIVTMGMIGRIDALSISAVGISIRITQIIWALFRGVAIGATVFVAQYYGAGNLEKVKAVIKQTLLSSIIFVAVLQLIIYIEAPNLLMIFGPQAELLNLATEFIRIVSFGLPFLAVMLIVGGVLQGLGNSRIPMLITLTMNLINIAVGYCIIFGKLGFSPLGVRGAAVASVVSQGAAAVMGLFILFRRNGILEGCFNRKLFSIDTKQIAAVYRVGLPSAMESVFWQLAAVILTRAMLTYGETAFAAYQLGLQAEAVSYMPAMGIGVVTTALIGQALGARNQDLARQYLKQILKGTFAITAVCTIMMLCFPKAMMSALTDDKEIIALSAVYLMLMGLVQFPQNLTGVLSGSMRGAGLTRAPMLIAGFGLWGVRVPLALLMTYAFDRTIIWIWIVMCVDIVIRSVVCSILFKKKSIYESRLLE